MVVVLFPAADDQGRHLDLGELGVRHAGDRLGRLGHERLQPGGHDLLELLRADGQQPAFVTRVDGDQVGPAARAALQLHDTLDAAGPDRAQLVQDVHPGQGHLAVVAPDDAPHRHPGDQLGVHQREHDRVPRAAGPAGGDDLLDAQLPAHQAQGLGPHVRLGLAVDLDVGAAAVGPVPQQHPLASVGQGVGQLVHTAVVLAEPAAGGDHHGLAVVRPDQLVDHDPAVDLDLSLGHRRPPEIKCLLSSQLARYPDSQRLVKGLRSRNLVQLEVTGRWGGRLLSGALARP